jgi:hypothetical protein
MWGWIPNGILAAGPSRVTIRRKATADIGAPRSLMNTYRPGSRSRWRRRKARSSMPVSGWTEGIPFLSRLTCKRPWTRSACSQRNEHNSDARKPCRSRCARILHLEPIGRAARTIGRVLPLRDDGLRGRACRQWAKTVSPSLNEGTQRYTNCNHIFLRLCCPHGAVDIRVRGALLLADELYRFLPQLD